MQYTLITGACGGLGGAFVEVLAERGEPLFLTGRSEERLKEAQTRIVNRFPGLPVLYGACDLTDADARTRFLAGLQAEEIAVKRLVYVAGVDTQMAFERYSQEKLLFQLRTNFEGAVSLIRGVLPLMPLDSSAEILTVGSMSASLPMPYFALYSATKKALAHFSVALRTELKGRARVTCVQPGGIPTREDIKRDIEGHGFWGRISVKSPREVALASLKAVRKNKRTRIIGFFNRIIWLSTRLTPLSWQLHFVAKRWSKTQKDAF